jgi:hypothetical protein
MISSGGIPGIKRHSVPGKEDASSPSKPELLVELPFVNEVKFPANAALILESAKGVSRVPKGVSILSRVTDVKPL